MSKKRTEYVIAISATMIGVILLLSFLGTMTLARWSLIVFLATGVITVRYQPWRWQGVSTVVLLALYTAFGLISVVLILSEILSGP